MRSIFIAFIALLSLNSFAAANDAVTEAHRGYHQVLLQCSERIWPGMDWSKTQFLLASRKTNQAWLIGANYAAPELLPSSEVPDFAYSAAFAFLDFRSVRTVTIGLDTLGSDDPKNPFRLAVHELFHNVGQKNWVRSGGGRGTVVPMDPLPRYVRSEISSELKKSLVDRSRLTDAANWFAVWSRDYPNELTSTTDGYEGTARYVDFLVRILMDHGCAISQASLVAEIQTHIGEFTLRPGQSFDSEGYAVGGLAGLLLDLEGREWKTEVPAGKTPLSILLNGKNTGEPVVNEAGYKIFESTYADLNAKVDLWRIPFEAKLNDPEYVRVAGPQAWFPGAFHPIGFFIPRDRPNRVYTPLSGEHRFDGPSGEFLVSADGSVNFMDERVPVVCDDAMWFYLVAKKDLQESAGVFRIDNGELKMEAGGYFGTDAEGFTYFCTSPK